MDTLLPADSLLDRLGHLEMRLKQAGAISDAGGLRLAIVEVMRMADEARRAKEPAPREIPATAMHI